MKAIRIAILHRSVVVGDAIGNDIVGMYLLLKKMQLCPTIVCEFPHEYVVSNYDVSIGLEPAHIARDYDLLIYHHSVAWERGEEIIASFDGPVIAKYHCVTPPIFFAPYSISDEGTCRRGREQTGRLARSQKVSLWMSDSLHNANELLALGVPAENSVIVPPFNRSDELVRSVSVAIYDPRDTINLLFVGRRVPHKGHRHLIRMLSSYCSLYSTRIRLRVVGARDEHLERYSTELSRLADDLGVTANIEWLSHVSNESINQLFCTSHLYVNASEHEGFCVPIIEAQAVGLPVVSIDCGAASETLGGHQAIVPLPITEEDFDVMAGLVHEIVSNEPLRRAIIEIGFKNVYERFSSEAIENTFVSGFCKVLHHFQVAV